MMRQRPRGANPLRRLPLSTQPSSRTMLVLILFGGLRDLRPRSASLSTNTKWSALICLLRVCHRVYSRANRVFFLKRSPSHLRNRQIVSRHTAIPCDAN